MTILCMYVCMYVCWLSAFRPGLFADSFHCHNTFTLFVVFKKTVPFAQNPLMEKLCEMTVYLFRVSNIYSPIGFEFVFTWMEPLKLSLVGFWSFEVLYQCKPDNVVIVSLSYLGKTMSLAFNYWI